MKRLLSLFLAAALLAALALPASAEETAASGAPAADGAPVAGGAPAAGGAAADARLAKVTQAVKKQLSLNTDAYESFHGSESHDLVPLWDLNWEGEKRSLSIQALEDGTVASLYRWDYNPASENYRWNELPVFPENGGGADQSAAEDFLARVLRDGETAELKDTADLLENGSTDSSWSGTLALNGLPSPLHWSLSVENGQVTSFGRDVPEASFIGGVPSPDAQADRAKAQEDLSGKLKLRLEYVLDKPNDAKAVLRYTPENAHEFLVDAKTGELLDVTELEEKLSKGYDTAAGGSNGAAPTAAEAAADRGEDGALTEVEQEGVAELEGVLAKEELDKALRAESAYGLRGYALISAAYETDGEDGVFCSLRYARTDGGERLARNITVNAKTGAVESVWSSAPFDREKTVTEEDALKRAEAFCKAWCPDKDLVLYQTDYELTPWRMEELPYWGFTFAQEVNGLPFRRNAVYVNIDTADGSIYGLSSSWDDAVAFDKASGVVSMETALAAWTGTYNTVLAYRKVPQKLNKADPVQAKLLEQDMEYYYVLRLTYGLEREEDFQGVDAKTGALIPEDRSSTRQPLTYTDLSGSAAKADIEKLAKYGVGYDADAFRPGKNITQWDLVALVYSLPGAALDPDSRSAEDRESEYYSAYRRGLLAAGERDDKAVLTRGEVVRMLLNAAGYGPAARLKGVYAPNYADKGTIPEDEQGYAAIAQALGMASGSYHGSRSATRGEAASMLCRVLERSR